MKKYIRQNEPHFRIDPASGCWVWIAALDKDGYGASWRDGGYIHAHIDVWIKSGRKRPSDGRVLDHLCKVRACVNPDHMEVVTPAMNVRRTSRTKLTWAQVKEIREKRERGVRVAVLAEMFGVCTATIYYIVGKGARSGWRPAHLLPKEKISTAK